MYPAKVLLLLGFWSSAAAAVTLPLLSSAAPTAYEILQSYNFPIGLLPKGATSYSLDPTTGNFSVNFDGDCSFSIQNSYQLRYHRTISGRISSNKLRDLRGISVKVLLFWVSIVEVDRIGANLEFSVGIAGADFPVDNFDESPQCGCGMNCGKEETARVRLRGSF
ncbi:uncharacterized protein LOC109850469 [Asparagus officinalis]|uniref:uncharacterized protein LOC109850469 n=1 Tax=Asparagus officinalis TaxID=4686 RepID=UPI00098E7B19|nr:uncharacterized protein LOC109850469 [Asparagus officinalis]